MFLSDTVRDKWGLPTVTFDCGWKTNELNMRKDMMSSAAEMLERAGLNKCQRRLTTGARRGCAFTRWGPRGWAAIRRRRC